MVMAAGSAKRSGTLIQKKKRGDGHPPRPPGEDSEPADGHISMGEHSAALLEEDVVLRAASPPISPDVFLLGLFAHIVNSAAHSIHVEVHVSRNSRPPSPSSSAPLPYPPRGWKRSVLGADQRRFFTRHAGALVAGVPLLDAGPPVVAGGGAAGQVAALAVLARELGRALAPVAPHLVDAQAAVAAGRRAGVALVDVLLAGLAREEGRAAAHVVGLDGGAAAAVGARVGGARVGLLAEFTCRRGEELH